MSCDRDVCASQTAAPGVPALEAGWAAGRRHCPNCGAFLPMNGVCSKCRHPLLIRVPTRTASGGDGVLVEIDALFEAMQGRHASEPLAVEGVVISISRLHAALEPYRRFPDPLHLQVKPPGDDGRGGEIVLSREGDPGDGGPEPATTILPGSLRPLEETTAGPTLNLVVSEEK